MTEFSKTAADLQRMDAEVAKAEEVIAAGDKEALLQFVSTIRGIQEEMETLFSQRMDKFRRRCTELDPITNQPRYGEQMRKKVEALLADYEQICERVTTVAKKVEEARVEAEAKAQELARQLAQQAEDEREKLLAAQREEEKGKAQREEEEAKRRAQEEADAHALALEAQKARAERSAREAAEAEAAERERARWRAEDDALVASVSLGVPGIEQNLDILRQSCGDPKAYRESIATLHLYVHNVIARPEDLTFRRIKQDNANFKAKVAGYAGGVQCLIAAGFQPQRDDTGAVLYVIEEPDFEKDNKTWTVWYDRTKEVRDKLLEESNKAKRMR